MTQMNEVYTVSDIEYYHIIGASRPDDNKSTYADFIQRPNSHMFAASKGKLTTGGSPGLFQRYQQPHERLAPMYTTSVPSGEKLLYDKKAFIKRQNASRPPNPFPGEPKPLDVPPTQPVPLELIWSSASYTPPI